MLSERHRVAIFLILLIFLLIGLLYFIGIGAAIKEGFADTAPAPSALQKSYTDLQANLQSTLGQYCDLTNYVQEQMKTMYMATKVNSSGSPIPGDSESTAEKNILQVYRDVYNCKDELASSRPSCAGAFILKSKGFGNIAPINPQDNNEFVPCSVYMATPAWISDSDTDSQAIALASIPDDLTVRVKKELEWYSQIIKKLSDALAAGNSPPSMPPDSPNSPSTDSSGKAWNSNSLEGFANPGQCTPSQLQAKLALLQSQKAKAAASSAAATAASCNIPSLNSQITRVKSVLASPDLKATLLQCSSLKASMLKLKSDQAKLIAGTLYSWQQPPTARTYKQYAIGDRTSSFTASLQQNQE